MNAQNNSTDTQIQSIKDGLPTAKDTIERNLMLIEILKLHESKLQQLSCESTKQKDSKSRASPNCFQQ